MTVTAADIRKAATAIADGIEQTPFVPSHTLSAICGTEIWLKLENLQFTASFKDRGALNKILSRSAAPAWLPPPPAIMPRQPHGMHRGSAFGQRLSCRYRRLW